MRADGPRSADDVPHCTLLSAIVLQIQTNRRQSDLFMNGALPRHTYLSGAVCARSTLLARPELNAVANADGDSTRLR